MVDQIKEGINSGIRCCGNLEDYSISFDEFVGSGSFSGCFYGRFQAHTNHLYVISAMAD